MSVAVRSPLGPEAGPKITDTKQDAPPAIENGGRLAQDPLLMEKSVVSPVMLKPLTVTEFVVGLLNIMFFKLEVPEVPIATGPIAIEAGETFNAFVPATVPVIGMDCGLSPAESVKTSCAVRVPVAFAAGLKVTATPQNMLGPVGVVQVLKSGDVVETVKSEPPTCVIVALVKFNVISPLFKILMSIGALEVPAACAGKIIGVGETEINAPLPEFPLSDTVAGESGAFVVTRICPLRDPRGQPNSSIQRRDGGPGANATVIVQFALDAKVVPQLLVSTKSGGTSPGKTPC